MQSMNIASPITGNNTAIEIDRLDTDKIIHQYRKELGMDVSRFFKDLQEVTINECIDSKYRFFYPYSVFGDSAFYRALQNVQGGNYYPKEKWEYQEALSLVEQGMTVLEIGSGAGYFMDKVRGRNATVTGLELNAEAAEDCRQKGMDVRTELLSDHARNNRERYDIVCAFQVLEHITEVRAFILDCLSVLKKGGLLVFAVPNSNPYLFHYDKYHTLNLPPHHAGLWNETSMKNMEHFFDLELKAVAFEPLHEYKKWFQVQRDHLKKEGKLRGRLMSLVPRQLYKPIVKLFRNRIEGVYLMATFKKI